MTATTVALMALQSSAEVQGGGLTPFSWSFMLLSMGSVTALTVWCFARIMRGKRHFDPDGTGPATPPVQGRVDREGGL